MTLTDAQRKAIFAKRGEHKTDLSRRQLGLLLSKYGADSINDPIVVKSRREGNFQEAARKAEIVSTYGSEIARDERILKAPNIIVARQIARDLIKKKTGLRFISPKRLEELREEGQEVAGQERVAKEFDRVFKEKLEEQVRLAKRG
jgi:hypothetical protein